MTCCIIAGCGRPVKARGLCGAHDMRVRRGQPLTPAVSSVRKRGTGAERFWRKVTKTADCWLWTASVDKDGYGQIRQENGVRSRAHRFAYELLVGPIPDGLQLDHLCRNPACVNPEHLEPVTGRVNTLRGVSPIARNARKTHCIRGHEFTPENTRIDYRGSRVCLSCRNIHPRN